MFKSRSRMLLILVFLIVGTCSSVFAIDFSTALTQAKEGSLSFSKVFKGSAQVSNLYQKALKLAKDREVGATTVSLDQLKGYYSECNGLTSSDFINVLYNSNASFALTFGQILSKKTKSPTKKEINASYTKFFVCKKISVPATSDQIALINNEINDMYYTSYSNSYSLSTINQENFGSDLFWNGTTDDSDFDLLYDINQIGKILFENVQDSPEVLFYRLPQITSPSAQNGSNLGSISDSNAYQLGNGGSSFSPTGTSSSNISGSSSTSPVASNGNSSSDFGSTASSLLDSTILNDKEIQSFLATTTVTPLENPAGAGLVFANQCLSPQEKIVAAEEEQFLYQDPGSYISGIVDFITTPNIDTAINNALLDNFVRNNPIPENTTNYASGVANAYAEQAFGEPALGTCEYSCRNLPLDKQALCELACAKSCIQTCVDTAKNTQTACSQNYTASKAQCSFLSGIKKTICFATASKQQISCAKQTVTDQALCVSDCTCFMIAGPNGKGREGIEDMYRIKFCKVPVQSKALSPGKTVFSIQAIFQEIADVLEGLKDSGQMVKFSKTKEFLDGTIKIKFADNFAFKILVGLKPVFPQKSTTTKTKEQQQSMRDFSLGIMNMNVGAPEADDYNKYIVISDPVTNDANMQQATSLEGIQANVDAFAAAARESRAIAITPALLPAITKSYVNENNILFAQNIVSFLQDNQIFWQNMSDALLDMNKMSIELKAKIENSK